MTRFLRRLAGYTLPLCRPRLIREHGGSWDVALRPAYPDCLPAYILGCSHHPFSPECGCGLFPDPRRCSAYILSVKQGGSKISHCHAHVYIGKSWLDAVA